VPPGAHEQRYPNVEDETRFWALLEAAWERQGPALNQTWQALAVRTSGSDAGISSVEDGLDGFLGALADVCRGLSVEELACVDRVAERKLYDIDRADIHHVTGGSDDGFLYARGFIVALGHDFYQALAGDPCMAVMNAECEQMCYFFAHLYRKRLGQFPETRSGISRESGANPAGWAN
jgi:hypothetical protein